MLWVGIISVIVFVAFLLCVLCFPRLRVGKFSCDTFPIAPLLGAILLIACGFVSPNSIFQAFTSTEEMNPLKILALFFSMTLISVYLDEAGFFKYLAIKSARSGSQLGFFLKVYLLVSVLTVFTSNDIVILTFTPFLCAYCKRAEVSPLPFLIMEFVAANTWSMLMIIGNPTNIYLATALGVNFVEYLQVMWLPTVIAGLVSLGALLLIFRKQLRVSFFDFKDLEMDASAEIKDKFLVTISLCTLIGCIVMLVVCSFVEKLQMWLISTCFALFLTIIILSYRIARKESAEHLLETYKRLPYMLIPFVLCMFVIVLALANCGLTDKIRETIAGGNEIFVYGSVSFIGANILNNIPMSVLFAEIASTKYATYAVIIASNIGALLTPVGALAGIMWSKITARHGVNVSIKQFVLYGLCISLPTLFASLGALQLVSLFF